MTSFDVMDGAVFGFGPTQSGLTIRAGRDPLVLEQLLLLMLPSVLSLHELLVLFVFGEYRSKNRSYPNITALSRYILYWLRWRVMASAICVAICAILASSWALLASRSVAARLPSLRRQLKAFCFTGRTSSAQ